MMTLAEAARYFDDVTFTDTYGTATFEAQVLPFADSVRSGESTRRRILDTGASVVIPAKRTVTAAYGTKYLVSFGSEDTFQGEVVRIKYPVLPVSTQFQIRSIDQILMNSGGVTDSYMSTTYIRRNLLEEQSDYLGAYHIYHSPYYTVHQGHVIYGAGRFYRARENAYIDDVGFGVVEAVEIDTPLISATYQSRGAYDPGTDSYPIVALISNLICLVEKVVLDFQHEALGYVTLEPGDRSISFLKAVVATPKVGDIVGRYRIVSLQDKGAYWTIQGRPDYAAAASQSYLDPETFFSTYVYTP